MKRKRYLAVSLGCTKNLVDTEYALGYLQQSGWEMTESEPDVIVVNTCAFIATARKEARDTVNSLKQEFPGIPIIVLGCLCNYKKGNLAKELGVSAVLPPNRYNELPEVIEMTLEHHLETEPAVKSNRYTARRLRLTLPHVAYLKPSDGCSNHCAYCSIPRLRGELCSNTIDQVITEARMLVESGAREINLIAQDLTAYGSDWDGKFHLVELIDKLASAFPEVWLRLLYCHPARINDKLLQAFLEHPNLCRYLDVPMQHVVPRLLRLMGRPPIDDPIKLWESWRSAVPGLAIRTTFIAGFPGESAEEHQAVLDFIKKAKPDFGGVFHYSREPGTIASKLPVQIEYRERLRRAKVVCEALNESMLNSARNKIETGQDVIVDAGDDCRNVAVGRHRGQAPDVDSVTHLLGRGYQAGEIVRVKIVDTMDLDLLAEHCR